MKQLNRTILTIALSYSIIFLLYVLNQYGLTKSISYSVKFLTQDNREILFFVFIFANVAAFMWLGRNSWLIIAGGMLLVGIAVITGYNKGLVIGGLQHIIHTALTTTAIFLSMIGIALQKRSLGILLTCAFGLFTLISFIAKYPNHTYWIEVCGFSVAYIYFFTYPTYKN